MNPAHPIGRALEFIDGHARERVCYGTFRGDMPDQNFRFTIILIEHEHDFKMHSHEYCELVIVLGGSGIHLTEYENHPLEEGDVCVINPGRRHGFQNPQHLRLCNIKYDAGQFLNSQRDLARTMGYHALFELQPRSTRPRRFTERLHLSVTDMAYVTNLISTLKSEYEGRADARQTVIRSSFHLLVAHLARCYAAQAAQTGTPLVRMAGVMSHIQKHFREPLRMEELARLAHWSPSQFRRNFKRIYQIPPHCFINQLRMCHARQMLADPNRDITSIAYETGFSSSAFFAAQFKRFNGESPSQYRRKKLAAPGGNSLRLIETAPFLTAGHGLHFLTGQPQPEPALRA